MLSISLGPLALPVLPMVLMLSVWSAATLARRLSPKEFGQSAENMVWSAAALGLIAARLAHVLRYADAYFVTPWALVDVRDGGWHAAAGWAVAALWLVWCGWRQPMIRRALGMAALGAGLIWMAGLAMVWLADGKPAHQSAPDVMLTEFNGARMLSLPQLIAGKPTVVNLWATWCGPCRAEMPTLAAAQQNTPDVAFVFVNQGEPPAKVAAYLQRSGLTLTNVWLDPASQLGPASGSRGLPTTLFFDATGKRVDAHFGMLNAAALQVQLERLRGR
ncbi:MAG: TlpA disulfide reductase family protein [Rhodoferax sp.]|uniref:TlpA disulfide reductase family protein n=1 Tax=Rhodoferax sp. TaxID=50421 RepID=UPI00262BD051|nr:TlpA disulfide reductase family protein [Rhodoferax sp.]MDD2882477.1 TlpA disulfide reductase family protein [Rhodoferax sp.]